MFFGPARSELPVFPAARSVRDRATLASAGARCCRNWRFPVYRPRRARQGCGAAGDYAGSVHGLMAKPLVGDGVGVQFTVAIDGPAASGKGTIGRAVAEAFGSPASIPDCSIARSASRHSTTGAA